AQQEVKHTKEMIESAKSPVPKASKAPTGLRKRMEEAQGPVELATISNIPITIKATDDSKVIYETVGKLAGINVLFDPDYTSRRIKIELNGVTLEEALEIIALESKTFWRPVTPNTIFIAADNPAKRKDLEQSVIKTFYLANLSQPTELQDVVNAMRQILEISRIQPLPSQGAIVVRGTPDQIALAEKLVGDLDKAKAEVIVDVAVLQINRDKSRTLGINPPTSATVALQNNITNTSTTTGTTSSLTSGTTSSTTGTPNQLNLNQLNNLNATDFTFSFPHATATALFSDTSTKLIQKPQIRAVDGQKASLKIGDRVPVATGSFQPGIGGVGINPLVNTQFQYLDVGVNIDITPKVHANGEVSLKMSMDVSAVDSYVSIGGISQPVIGQRKIENEIRLKDGEVSLLGGMMEDTKTKSLSGLPGLSSIPILRYFFSQDTSDHSTNEIVFILIPHIVRGLDASHSGADMIDVGTANALSLRRTSTRTAPSTPATPQGIPQAQPAQNQIPPTQAGAGTGTFLFDPPTLNQTKGSTFTVNVMLSGGQNVYSVPVQLSYD